MTKAKGKKRTVSVPAAAAPIDLIKDHKDRCSCSRCVGLTECHCCKRIKLDFDWCFNCGRFVL